MRKLVLFLLTVFLLGDPVYAADKIRIGIPPGAGVAHATFLVAQKRGFLREEGLEPEIIEIGRAHV